MTGEASKLESRIVSAQVDWDANAPRSIFFGDIYFSGDGEAEAGHVFLKGNALEARFAGAARFSIGELGFGTGLNFLTTWALWRRAAGPRARLRYFSVERFPLDAADLARAHRAWPGLQDLAARLRAALPPPARGLHQIDMAEDVTLLLGLGEAGDILARAEGPVDAWFFDGFSPAKNPDMWRTALFEEAARLSAPTATFATFTVAGDVRRALAAAGFAAEKCPGFGRKREMLCGRIERRPARSPRASWFQPAGGGPLAPGARLAIIGGGIAGASLAREARRAGLRPTIFDPEGLAAGASGNRAGLVMPRLDLGGGAGARFFLLSYLHTIRLLTSLSKDPSEKDLFNACGVLLGATRDEEHERHKKLLAENTAPPDHVRPHDRGLFFPQAGVVDPRKFVAALADGTSVIRRRVVAIERASLLEKGEESRLALRLDNHSRAACDAVVIANGTEALAFLEARALPLAAVAGQIDWFPKAAAPASALAFGPYAAPAPEGGLLIGATYRKGAAAVSRAASEENIRALAAFAPEIAARLDPADAIPRAAMRCQTPDRLPVAGPLPDLGFYAAAYEGLRDGRVASAPGRMIPGVFILSGLGSRGLVTAPLAAAMLIAEMTGAIAPLPADIAEALHPARFFIRDLKRTRKIRKA